MKDIFSDIYDRVLNFFTSQNNPEESKLLAKSRLRTVLMQDRVGFSERAMQMLKDDMIESISKYLEIDVDSFDLSIDANESATILNLSIPVLRPKTDEEIDEALALQQKANIEKTQEIVDELQELVKEKAHKLAEQIVDGEEADEDDEQEETAVQEAQEESSETKEEENIENSEKKVKKEKKTKKEKADKQV